jgi:hypothetical protein
MGGACRTHGGIETCIKDVAGKTVAKRAPKIFEIILKCVFKK